MFEFTFIDVETVNPIFKAIYMVQRHKEKEKRNSVHNATTARYSFTRLTLAKATARGFELYSEIVSQAHLQAPERLNREVYIKPGLELKAPNGYLLKLKRSICGLSDSDDIWNATYTSHSKNTLGMDRTITDMPLFYKIEEKKTTGIMATYVDNSSAFGRNEFDQLIGKTGNFCEAKHKIYYNLSFTGAYAEIYQNIFRVYHKNCTERLQLLLLDSGFRKQERSEHS